MSDNNHASHLSVSENGAGRYQQNVLSGRHVLIADEPVHAGGDDAGLAPYDFLLAALGACTSMTLRMYAEHKELPLKRVHVDLRHEKIRAADQPPVDRIERIITLEGDLTPEQRQRMLEIANKCPVYRTLTSNIQIESTITA
ncbi:MAG: OsmC family protein [Propionivibrio sp.]|mgnify:CR=1 FL=1|jgi:putative redox protein|uniref:OsmC family protein n=1 Tax=Propionivibrio sp. TaxID=2212460 RepID=UPI001B4592DD|nr:OsmC family protein [Propionivibrio sp.]MBP7201826.1 OsmC family protein [Propionivibrio sp.]